MVEYRAEELKTDPKLAENVIKTYAKAYTGEYLQEFKSTN
jgi:hypothetical protein